MGSNLLSESAWKAIAVKCKIKDIGLQKALAAYDKIDEKSHDECLKGIASVSQLATTLKKSKEVSASPEALKYLNGLAGAADTEKNDVAKLKAEAQKAQVAADKAKVAADKAQSAADKVQAQDDEEAQEEGDYKTKLLSAFQKVKTAKDQVYQFIVCDTKPFPGLMIAKRISPAHKVELTKVTGGGKKFLKPGTVTFDSGHFVFTMDQPVPGLARKLQTSVKNFTGKKFPIMIGTESSEDDGQSGGGAAVGATTAAAGAAAAGPAAKGAAAPKKPEPAPNLKGPFSISASVGQGGKNQPQDVQAVQVALNAKGKAGLVVDGKCGPKTIAAIKAFQQQLGKFKPDGLVEVGRGTARALAGAAMPGPAPAPPNPVAPPKLGTGTLDKAPTAWQSTRANVQRNFGELKKAIRGEYASEHPTLVKDIEQNLKKLDAIMDRFDTSLADTLAKANSAKDAATRKVHLQNCKAILTGHMKYVQSEPLIAHIDSNPWVQTNCKKMLSDCFLHVAQALGK